jgi:hypothetical protein
MQSSNGAAELDALCSVTGDAPSSRLRLSLFSGDDLQRSPLVYDARRTHSRTQQKLNQVLIFVGRAVDTALVAV